jgi:hypothetical protein
MQQVCPRVRRCTERNWHPLGKSYAAKSEGPGTRGFRLYRNSESFGVPVNGSADQGRNIGPGVKKDLRWKIATGGFEGEFQERRNRRRGHDNGDSTGWALHRVLPSAKPHVPRLSRARLDLKLSVSGSSGEAIEGHLLHPTASRNASTPDWTPVRPFPIAYFEVERDPSEDPWQARRGIASWVM